MLNATRLHLKNHISSLQQFMASPRAIRTLAPSYSLLCQADAESGGVDARAVVSRVGRGRRRTDPAYYRPLAGRWEIVTH